MNAVPMGKDVPSLPLKNFPEGVDESTSATWDVCMSTCVKLAELVGRRSLSCNIHRRNCITGDGRLYFFIYDSGENATAILDVPVATEWP